MATVVQSNKNGAVTASLATQFASNVTANNRIVVCVGIWETLPLTVTDSAGNTYTKDVNAVDGSGYQGAIYSAPITAGAGTRITVTVAGSGSTDTAVMILEVSGLTTISGSSAVDAIASATGTSTSAASGVTTATTEDTEGAIGSVSDTGFSNSATAGSGWTLRDRETYGGGSIVAVETRDTGVAGNTYNAQFTLTGSSLETVTLCVIYHTNSFVPPIPTRFYVDSGGTAPLASLSFAGLWDRTTDVVRRPMNTTKQNSSLVTTAKQCGSISANWDVCHYQFQSGSLPADGTLSGTFKCWFQGLESATGANAYPQVAVRVVSSDGSTVRGTAYSGGVQTAVSATVEFDSTTVYQAQRFPDSRDSNALTNVSYFAGDHIVVEIGIRHLTAGGTTQTATIRVGDATANSDMAETQNGSTLSNPWIEFSQELFPTSNPVSDSDTGTGADVVANVGLSPAEAPTVNDAPTLIAFTVAESASAIDGGQSSGGKAGLDTATGTDVVTRIGLSPAEVGSGVDVTTLVGALQTVQAQTGTGADVISKVSLSSADVVAGNDITNLISLAVAETASGVDSGSVISVGGIVSKSGIETASGIDAAKNIAISGAQSAAGIDSFIHNTFTTVSEQGHGSKGIVGQVAVGFFIVDSDFVGESYGFGTYGARNYGGITGLAGDSVASIGLAVGNESAIITDDIFVTDLGTTNPIASETGTVIEGVSVRVIVAEVAGGNEFISLALTRSESGVGADALLRIARTLAETATGVDAVSGVSQGTIPHVAQSATVVDFARVTLLVSETGTVTENRSIPIWGPLSDAVVVGPLFLTTATVIYAGHANAVSVTAGHTSVIVVNLPTAVQVTPLLTTQITLANNGQTMLRVFRPGQVVVGQELFLSETAIKLIRRAEHREKALAMRQAKEDERERNGNRQSAKASSLSSLRGTGKLVRGPKQ